MDESFRGTWINIDPYELRELSKTTTKKIFLLDVRNQNEQDICVIPNTDLLIPVKELDSNLHLLPPKDFPILVYCKSGVRSQTACKTLLEHGFTNLYHLDGGILAYAREIDPEMAEY
jgi:sulfur-carrier protein adenylyltransferase/sulfurtransferase